MNISRDFREEKGFPPFLSRKSEEKSDLKSLKSFEPAGDDLKLPPHLRLRSGQASPRMAVLLN